MSTFNSLQATAHAHVKVLAKGKGGNTKFTCKHCNKQFTSFTHQVTGGCHAFVKLFFFLLCCSRVCSSLSQLIARFAVMPHPAAELPKIGCGFERTGATMCLANKCMFEWFVWERHSLTIVILQLTHNSYQDKIQLDLALFCSSEHFLDFAFICLLALALGVRYVPVPMQVITWLATVKLRDCCRPSLPSFTCKDWLEVGKDGKDHQQRRITIKSR